MTTKVSDTKLALTPSAWKDVCRWAEAGYPLEGCGLLLGRAGAKQTHVVRAVRASHATEELAREGQSARASGLEVVGTWRSRPDGPARPPDANLEPDFAACSHLVAGIGSDWITLRAWRLVDGSYVEELVVVDVAEAP